VNLYAVKTTGIPVEWLQVAAYTIPTDFPDRVRCARAPLQGRLYPDLSRPGLGLELKRVDAERYAA